MNNPAEQAALSGDEVKALEKLSEAYRSVRQELSKVIVGQNEVIEQLMIAIFRSRPLSAGRRSWIGQNADGQHARSNAEP